MEMVISLIPFLENKPSTPKSPRRLRLIKIHFFFIWKAYLIMFFLLQGRDSNAIPHQKRNMGAIEPQSSLQGLLILFIYFYYKR